MSLQQTFGSKLAFAAAPILVASLIVSNISTLHALFWEDDELAKCKPVKRWLWAFTIGTVILGLIIFTLASMNETMRVLNQPFQSILGGVGVLLLIIIGKLLAQDSLLFKPETGCEVHSWFATFIVGGYLSAGVALLIAMVSRPQFNQGF